MIREERHYWILFIFAAWAVPTIVAWSLPPSLQLHFVLLVWQQALFIIGGLWGSRYQKWQPLRLKTLGQGLVAGLGLFLANSLIGLVNFQVIARVVGLDVAQKLILQEQGGVQVFFQSGRPLLVVGVIMLLLIGAPIGEELFFRRFLLTTWEKSLGQKGAIFCSALLFAILHFYFVQFIPVLVAGVLLGLIYVRTNNIFVAIIAHSVVNIVVLIGQFGSL